MSTAQVHHGLTYEQYAKLPGWSWSVIKHMDESPLHCLHAKRSKDTDTASRGMLRAVHALTLEPHTFAREYSVFDGHRRGKAFDAFAESHAGTTILNGREYELAKATAHAIRTHPIAGMLFAEGRPEVSITWQDFDTGLPCKARLDWLGPRLFLDLKTFGTTNPRIVARRIAAMGVHGQLAHYDDALRTLGIDVPAFVVVAEGKGAQDVGVFEADEGIPDGALYVGRQLRSRLLARIAECLDADRWPGRNEDVVSLCLPDYALDDPEITTGDEPDNANPFDSMEAK